MSTVIAFLGGPRKNGISAKLVERAIEGAKAAGAEVITYDLNEDGVKGCQGCFYCRANDGCATQDKLQPMYEQLKTADGIIAGFPIYFHTITAQGKILIDRLYPMLGANFVPRHPGKNVVTIYTQANPNADTFKAAIEKVDSYFTNFGWNVSESLLAVGTGAPGYVVPEDLMNRAFEAGKALVK